MSPKSRTRGPAPTEKRLRKLIAEGTVDCYHETHEKRPAV